MDVLGGEGVERTDGVETEGISFIIPSSVLMDSSSFKSKLSTNLACDNIGIKNFKRSQDNLNLDIFHPHCADVTPVHVQLGDG